ncbi:MAG: NAD(P)H-dependent oxidoreductase subunit E [Lacipirellulaceae bacterium]
MPALSPELRAQIEAELVKYPVKQAATLPALHLVHDAHRAVSTEALKEIAQILDLHPSQVYDTMSFYGFFREAANPMGRDRMWVCRSLSCALRGGEELLASLSARWGVAPGHTTGDGRVSLEYAECLGACEGAPCLLLNDVCHLNMTEESAARLVEG